ncbi:MAG: hypothetical protein OCD01_11595 [Fibrobacterales bacterium]
MSLLSAALLIFLVIDPFGNIPVFLSSLRNTAPERRKLVIIRELLIALAILLGFLFFGKYILHLLQVSPSSLGIGGAIVLIIIALRMIFQGSDSIMTGIEDGEPLIVPLAIPLIAGPSTMTLLTVFIAREPDRWDVWLMALLSAWFVSGIILVFAQNLFDRFGSKLLVAIERLIGLLLVTVAVEMFVSELKVIADTF